MGELNFSQVRDLSMVLASLSALSCEVLVHLQLTCIEDIASSV